MAGRLLHSFVVAPGTDEDVYVADTTEKIDVRIVQFVPEGTDRSVTVEDEDEATVLVLGTTNNTGESIQPLEACIAPWGLRGTTINVAAGAGCAALVNLWE